MHRARLSIVGVLALFAAGCGAPPTAGEPSTNAAATEMATAEATPTSALGMPNTYLGAAAWSARAAAGGVWIQVDPPVDQVVKVDTSTAEVTVEIDGGRGIGTDGTEVWVARGPAGLAKVDPMSGETLLEIAGGGSYAAVGSGSVWSPNLSAIGRWNATSGELQAEIPVEVSEVTELLFAHGALWVTAKVDGVILRIDPESNSVAASIPTGSGAHGIAADESGVWVTNYEANSVSRIDLTTNEVVATIEDVGSGVGIVAAEGSIWVSTQGLGISRIDPATNEANLVVELPFEWNYGVAVDNGALWISSVDKKIVYQVDIARLGS